MHYIYSLLRPFLDFVFPPTCFFCRELLSANERHLCSQCWQSIPAVSRNHPLYMDTRAKLMEGGVSDLVSCFVFEKEGAFQTLAHSLKYEGFTGVGVGLGRRLGETLIQWKIKADVLVPIPLHRIKYRERGFNQAEHIALGLSEITGIPVRNDLVRRTRHTKTQTRLGIEDRKRNVEGAFDAAGSRSSLEGTNCILVDDVITTGSTIAACARQLLIEGASSVAAASSAIAE